MTDIRPATLKDRAAILAIAKAETARYPRLKLDIEKLHAAITAAVSSNQHFAWVVETGGQIKGVLLGLTGDNLWAQRQNCNISLWTCTEPGGGAALLRKFRDWVLSRRAIKVAGMCPDLDLDPRVYRLAERIGFKRYGGAYLLYN